MPKQHKPRPSKHRLDPNDKREEVDEMARFFQNLKDHKKRTGQKRFVKVHEHQLEPIDTQKGVRCGGCERQPSGQMYACNLCRYSYHETCANLPLEVTPFFHPCPLSLFIHRGFSCNACLKGHRNVFSYRCEKCDFDMDAECATQVLSIPSDGGENRTLHYCHPHPLVPLAIKTRHLVFCRICEMVCSSGPTWGCESCNFQVHKSCLEIIPGKIHIKLHPKKPPTPFVLKMNPSRAVCLDCKQIFSRPSLLNLGYRSNRQKLVYRISAERRKEYLCISCCLLRKIINESSQKVKSGIEHFFHPCPLKLVFSPFSKCNACFETSLDFLYHCIDCNFFLDLHCAQLPKVSHPDERNQIHHFCHWHPLKLFLDIGDRPTSCKLCDNSFSESFYGCIQCHFYVHKDCINILPQKTIHHILNKTITLLPLRSFECTTCSRACTELAFRCTKRKYNFCVKCILHPVENKFIEDGIFMSIHHWHPLSIQQMNKVKQAICYMCGERCSGKIYSCKKCSIFFHKGCINLPKELFRHPIHLHHSLTLIDQSALDTGGVTRCKLCLKDLSQSFSSYNRLYRCEECCLYLDARCASFMPSVCYQRHPHLLYVVENLHDEASCELCNSSCKGSSVLRCAECNFNMHIGCGPLPCTISRSCHVHALALEEYYVEENETDDFACHVCENYREPKERIYRCIEDCPMICELKCLLPEVHKLLRGKRGVVELKTLYPEVFCEVIIDKDSVFKEMSRANKNEGGVDENLPMNKYVFSWDVLQNFSDSDSDCNEKDTFSIDVLEETCMDDGSKAKKDESKGAIEVVRMDGKQGKSGLIVNDSNFDFQLPMYSHFTVVENLYENLVSLLKRSRNGEAMDSNHLEALKNIKHELLFKSDPSYTYSPKAFNHFMEHLDLVDMDDDVDDDDYNDTFSKHNGSRMLGVYSLPEVLAPIYEDFISKYKVFGVEISKLGFLKRRYIVFIISCILHEMRMTKVVDIQRDKIMIWLCALKQLEKWYGVQLGFMLDPMIQIAKVHFIVQVSHQVDSKLSTLREEICQLSEKEKKLTEELKETRMMLQKKKIEEEVYDTYKAYGVISMKKEHKDALEIKWRTCHDVYTNYQNKRNA